MKDGLFSFSDFMVKLSWFDYLKFQFTKRLDLSLGVNQMWIKRDDRAPKGECVDICP